MHAYYAHVAMVVNVEVEVVTDMSVRVSWDLLDISEITGYIVYYSQKENTQSVNVTNSTNSAEIGGLMSNYTEYQFQVAAVAELDGYVVIGERSIRVMALTTIPTSQGTESHLF